MHSLRNQKKLCGALFRSYCSSYTEYHYAIQRSCERFSSEKLKPVASSVDKSSTYPKDEIKALADLGLMGMTASPEYGGAGLDMKSVSLAVEELSRGCASTGAIVSIHNILYVDLLSNLATNKQKESFLKPYTQGIPGAFALSETNAGSDVANISTTAKSNGDHFVLNGTKAWVTSAHQSEVAVVFATVDKSMARKGITAFIVPLNTEGVSLGEPDQKMGIRAASTCEVSLCDVCIPKENILGEIGGGFKIAMQQLNKARIGIASQAIGIAQAALDTALNYAMLRSAFGKKLSDLQAVQLRLARVGAQLEGARLLVRKAADLCDKNANIIKAAAMAKLMASEAANFSANQCIQVMGGMGFVQSMPAERHYRDARITEIYGGVSDIQMLVIAEQLIKEKRK